MWNYNNILEVYEARYDPVNKKLILKYNYSGSLPLTVWWMDSPMGGYKLEENLSAGSYGRSYQKTDWPNLYAVWFRMGSINALEIPVDEMPLLEEPEKISKLPLIMCGIGLAVVFIAVAKRKK